MKKFLFLLFGLAYSAKILVYSPKFAFSHLNFMANVADTLQISGHNVTVLMPTIRSEIRGTRCTKARLITPNQSEKMKQTAASFQTKDIRTHFWTTSNYNPIGSIMAIPMMKSMFITCLDDVLTNSTLIRELKTEAYDMIIHELFDFSGFAVQHKLGIKKALGIHTTVLFDETASIVGLPRAPGTIPDLYGIGPADGSFASRLIKYFYSFFSNRFERKLMGMAQDYMNEHFENPPTIPEMIVNLSFIFVNSDPLLDYPRPTLHKIVDIGGLGIRNAKPLSKDWEELLSRRNTNILVSFGSVAPSSIMPQTMKDTIVGVVQEFPFATFIWKYENASDGTGRGVSNLHLSDWTPQTDLLASGKIDLFITHGGAASVGESALSAVPTIAIPLFGDQMRNARMTARFGCSVMFNKRGLTDAAALKDVIEKALNNKRLKERALLAQKLIKLRPSKPEDLLISHVQLAIDFPDLSHLNPEARRLNFVEYYNIDVYTFLLSIFVLLIWLCFKVVTRCFQQRSKGKIE